MIELPAIFLTLALSMGQLAIPVAMPELWQIGGYWVIPMLAIAAAGEGLWMGRQGIFEN